MTNVPHVKDDADQRLEGTVPPEQLELLVAGGDMDAYWDYHGQYGPPAAGSDGWAGSSGAGG